MTVDVLGTPPDDVVLLDPRTVPKTSSGKIRRAACRDLYRQGKLTHPPRHPRLALARLTLRSWMPRARDLRHAVVDLAYALYAWSVMIALAFPTAFALLVTPRRRWRLAVVRRALRLLARLTCVGVTVTGREHLVASLGGAVVVANHPSWIDGAVLASVLPGAPVFVVAADLAQHAWSGPFLRRIGVEFVQRATHEQGAGDTRRLIAAARAGQTLVVFPEGRLSHVPGLRAFRLGAFLTAAEAHLPVVPVAIRGTRSVLPPGRRFPRHGAVFVDVGEPIVTDQPGWEGAVELQRAARRAAVLAGCGEPDIA